MNWQELHTYWFGKIIHHEDYVRERQKIWFGKLPEVDEYIINHFTPLLDEYEKGELVAWQESPQGYLSLIILLDQISRNSFRGDSRSYKYDLDAVDLTTKGIIQKIDLALDPIERMFFYLPLEHSEKKEVQAYSLEVFTKLCAEYPNTLPNQAERLLGYVKKHKEIIDRFGRFPHRNIVLGRESTIEELEFLKQPGSSF